MTINAVGSPPFLLKNINTFGFGEKFPYICNKTNTNQNI